MKGRKRKGREGKGKEEEKKSDEGAACPSGRGGGGGQNLSTVNDLRKVTKRISS